MAIQILQAITQHVNYLAMVRRTIADGVEHSRCCDHHSCKFGTWYDSDGTGMVNRLATDDITALWREIGRQHEAFHAESMAAVEALATDQAKAVALETAMMQRSTLLVNRLLDLDTLVTRAGVA
ncbi:CZB domain-containing protein [Acidocella sp.]|uniref:CZB domain-containing protein n=1 Tax=Acidocella sp. TaxID=50710 RepID=UPI00260874BA|nr:CZB domain-containing protein [Acidocella sp.]